MDKNFSTYLDEQYNSLKQIVDKLKKHFQYVSLLASDVEGKEIYDYNFENKVVIIDEAQAIKNYQTKNSEAVKEIRSVSRFAITGTPIENSLTELWSIFDYIMPGFLANLQTFDKKALLCLILFRFLILLYSVLSRYFLVF